MSNKFEHMSSPQSPKREWVKPVVRQLKAGAAEFGSGTKGDGAGGGSVRS